MPGEAVLAALIGALTPTIIEITKSGMNLLKNQKTEYDIRRSTENIARHVLDINTVKTLWEKDRGILIDSFYYPLKVIGKRHRRRSELKISFKEKAILEGVVGQGKSIFLRNLCLTAVKEGMIPFFIELRLVSKETSFEQLVLEHLDILGLEGSQETFDYLAKSGKIVMILDGFDEIALGQNNKVISSIERIRKKYSNLGVIISSRPFHDAQSLAGFEVYTLASLKQQDYDGFLKKLIPETTRRFLITEAIENAPTNIKGVITTPLMLTLLVLVYESESEIPSTLPDFFDKLFNTVFSRHDKLKAGFERRLFTKLSESKLQRLFDAFCFMVMQETGSRSVKTRQFELAFEKAQKYTQDCKCELEDFRKDIIKVSCLMLEDGIDKDTFLHKSIMEFHAASFIKKSNDSFSQFFYQKVKSEHIKWSPVLTFLSNIDSYRYGRDYILKTYPPHIKELSELLLNKNQKELIQHITKRLPELSFGVSSSELSSIYIGRNYEHHFDSVLMRTIVNCAETEINSENSKALHQAIRSSPKTDKHDIPGVLDVSLKSFIENFDNKPIWTGLSAIQQDMMNEVEKYQLIVDAEDRKHEIFS